MRYATVILVAVVFHFVGFSGSWSFADQAQNCLIISQEYEKVGPAMRKMLQQLQQKMAERPFTCEDYTSPLRLGVDFYPGERAYALFGVDATGGLLDFSKVDFKKKFAPDIAVTTLYRNIQNRFDQGGFDFIQASIK